jgi:hypothetical protein
MGADEIAHQWTAWREQIDDATAFTTPAGTDPAGTGAELGAEPEAGAVAESGPEPQPEVEGEVEVEVDVETGPEAGDEPAANTEAGTDAEAPAADAPSGVHPGVRRALAQAQDYVDAPPPPGRVRSSFATGDARMLRADGPGWSLVARTDDIAFVLLDEEPGEVLPVGRGTELPGLLKALDALAVRPA